MNPLSIPPILSSLLFLVLGVFIYFQNKKSTAHLTFLFICITTFWWQFSWFFLFNTQNKTLAEIIVKVGHIGIILLPVIFLHFVISFLHKTDRFNKWVLYVFYFITLLFELSLFTNYLINGYYKYFWGFYPKANFLHPFFILFMVISVVRMSYLLLAAIRQKTINFYGRLQIQYILIAIIFYTFAASDFLVNYGFEFYPMGFISILFFLGAIGYAIAKYRLMDVKIILTEILVLIIALLLLGQFLTSVNHFEYIWKGILLLVFLIFGYLLIKSVILEIKRRTELQRLYQQVNKLSKAKSEFISIASHQLRTPLTAIKGYISMIIEGVYGKLSEKQASPLENVYQSSERLIKLVNDLLNLSRLEAGKIEFKPEPAFLENIVFSVAEELKINAEKKGLYMKIMKPSASLPEIMIDQDKLRQVILNIIDNAIKYTQAGGITVALKQLDFWVRITVSDTGEGMAKEEMAGLFQTFTRAHAGTRLNIEGAGIGLYVAKKFVEMHKGKIWAESQGRGKGSTFFIELPVK